MKIVSYTHNGHNGVGALEGDLVVPFTTAQNIREVAALDLRTDVLNRDASLPLSEVHLRAASPEPSKVFCVGLNYLAHVEETHRDLPTYPVLFPKYASSLIGPNDPIQSPPEGSQLDYEAELAVIIGVGGRRISEANAHKHILGYAVSNDVTVRDYQYKTHQWLQGKAWDNTTPLGPAIVTPDEVDISTARITTVLNGKTMQDSDLSRLIFSLPRLIATVSEFTELEAGDVILTGTPGGVGYRRDPQVFLHPGDTVTVEVAGVGRIDSTVVAETV